MPRTLSLILVWFCVATLAAAGMPGRETYGNGEDLKVPEKARKEFDQGMKAIQANDLAEAQKHLEKAIEEYPQYARACNALGVVYMKAGQPVKGREAFEKAVALDNNNAEALINLGKIRVREKNNAEAEKLFGRAVLAAPANAEALTLLASVQFAQDRYEEAAANASKVHALEDHAQFAVAHYIAAQSYERLHQDAEAIAEYTIFLKEAPSSPLAEKARAALKSLRDQNYPN
jgi:Flp pilus assembly protein TadD